MLASNPDKPFLTVGLLPLLSACCLLPSAVGLVTRGRKLALSTLDDAHRAHRLLFIGSDGCDVAFLQIS